MQDPIVGRVLDDRYAVRSRVAGGGMATVYTALDQRLDRLVAVKIMHPHLVTDEQFVRRFVHEARAAARLSHPNVVQVFDQGRDGDLLYLAMEYLPGLTLRELLTDRGALGAQESLDIIRPVLDALAAAHRAHLVHRDVKPENVILTEEGRVKVADFGLARAVTAATTTGTLIGTVAYLAPELVTGEASDARGDVYAAGVMFFEMLTGRQPFTGDTPIQVAYQHVHRSVPPASALAPDLDPGLDRGVAALTARDPRERPADAGAALALLDGLHPSGKPLPAAWGAVRPGATDHADPLPASGSPEAGSARPHDLTEPEGHPRIPIGNGGQARPAGGAGVTEVVDLSGGLHPTAALPELRRGAARVPTADLSVRRPPPGTPGPPRPRQDDATDRKRGRARRGRRGIVLVLFLALLGVAAGTAWYLLLGPGADRSTPPVVGRMQPQAVATLQAAGLRARIHQQYSDTVPAGQVMDSDPGPGRSVRRGSWVTLDVSMGPRLTAVPPLAGIDLATARSRLSDASLRVGDVRRTYDENVPAGRVVSSMPASGQQLRLDHEVDLVLSRGPAPVPVPDVRRTPQTDAVDTLVAGHLVGEVITVRYDADVPKGEVITQRPLGGTAARGSVVYLTISLGPVMVPVPHVVDQKYSDAKKLLESKGFHVKRQGMSVLDRVLTQSPGGGSSAPRGSTVTLTTV